MKIYLASDHAGFEFKEEIKKYLKEQGMETEDLGAFELNKDDDYPDFVASVAKKVAEDSEHHKGIVVGGTGQGEGMVANKISGIRAAVFYGSSVAQHPVDATGRLSIDPLEVLRLSRAHNNANILSLGARFLTKEQAIEAVQVWLDTSFEGGRHERRLKKIDQIGQ